MSSVTNLIIVMHMASFLINIMEKQPHNLSSKSKEEGARLEPEDSIHLNICCHCKSPNLEYLEPRSHDIY